MAGLGALVFVTGSGWLLMREKKPEAAVVSKSTLAVDAAHEKVFLAEQLRRNSTHTPILLRLAEIERKEGNLAAARKYLEQASAADGKQIEVRLELGLVCWEMGDMNAAEEQNRAVLGIDPGQPDALYNMGAISANRGDTKRARDLWTEAVRGGRNAESVNKSRQAMQRLEAMR